MLKVRIVRKPLMPVVPILIQLKEPSHGNMTPGLGATSVHAFAPSLQPPKVIASTLAGTFGDFGFSPLMSFSVDSVQAIVLAPSVILNSPESCPLNSSPLPK